MSSSSPDEAAHQALEKALAAAIQAHQAGELGEAEQGYREILAKAPNAPQVLRMLGLAIHQSRGDAEAIALLERAVELAPNFVEARRDLARIHRARGNLDPSIAAWRAAIELAPERKRLHDGLGNALRAAGRLEEAETAYQRALEIDPGFVDAVSHLAITRRRQNRIEEATQLARRALELQPDTARHHGNLGNILMQAGHNEEAAGHQRRAVQLDPDLKGGFTNLGLTLATLGRYRLAEEAFRRGLQATPDDPRTLVGLANTLVRLDRGDEAAALFARARELAPRDASVLDGLAALHERARDWEAALDALERANTLQPNQPDRLCRMSIALEQLDRMTDAESQIQRALDLAPQGEIPLARKGEHLLLHHRFDEARALCEHALARDPNAGWARFALGHLELTQGNFRRGFAANEARWQMKDFARSNRRREFDTAPWDGSDPSGKTLLLWAEQGMGDAIQFARYAPLVAQRGARVVLSVHRPLVRLFRSLPGVAEVIERGESHAYDEHCPLLSLPHLFQTEIETIPPAPYLEAEERVVDFWKRDLGPARKLRVGLAWAGNPEYRVDRLRSLVLDQLAPLFDIEGVEFYSLQKGPGAVRADGTGLSTRLLDHTARLDDFMDTAGLASNLDLVVSSDTSVAHLMGALGIPVWILVPYLPDWRWLLERTDCPWYPSARLFRQPKPLDWQTPVESIARALMEEVQKTAQRPAPLEIQTREAGDDEESRSRPLDEPSDPPASSGGFGDTVRRLARSKLTQLLLGVVAIIFLSLGIESRVQGPTYQPAARVNGTEIRPIDLDRAERRLIAFARRFQADALRPDATDRRRIRSEALERLIDEILLTEEVERRDIKVTDDELREHLANDPTFQVGGRFDRARYDRVLASQDLTPGEYEGALRDDLARRKLRRLLGPDETEVVVADLRVQAEIEIHDEVLGR